METGDDEPSPDETDEPGDPDGAAASQGAGADPDLAEITRTGILLKPISGRWPGLRPDLAAPRIGFS